MNYTLKIQRAIRFAIRTHEIYQKQKRKGKDIPYITHPLIAGLILSRVGANEDVVIAGILHDSIEDTNRDREKTRNLIVEKFGNRVLELVNSVTEQNKELSWDERKAEALSHIKDFDHDSLMLKSADIISNTSETINDYEKEGKAIFSRFSVPKEKRLGHDIKLIEAIMNHWPENPLKQDLEYIKNKLKEII